MYSQNRYLPAQLGGNEIAVRTVLERRFVHAADETFLARFVGEAQLQHDFVDFAQDWTVDGINVHLRCGLWIGNGWGLNRDSFRIDNI